MPQSWPSRIASTAGPRPGSEQDRTYFWVDPQEELFAVMMVQMPFVPAGAYRRALREMVYGALLH